MSNNTLSFSPQPQQQMSIEQALQYASQLHSTGKLQEAEGILNQVLQAQPNNPFALHLLGLVACSVNKLDIAVDLITKAISFENRVPIFHANIGEIYRLAGNVEKAIEHGKKAIELDPNMASAHSNLGIAYFDVEDFERAKACHEKALAINPGFAQSLNNLGSMARDEKDLDKAVEYYQKAVSVMSPGYIEPLNNLGATLTQLERYTEALELLNRAIAQNPMYSEAICNRGFASLGLDRYKDAIDDFIKALQLKAEYPEAFHGMAKVYRENRKYFEAESAIAKTIELEPEKAENYATLATIYALQDKSEEALDVYNKALSLDPGLASAKMGIGNILVEKGDFKEAEVYFREVLESDPEDKMNALFSIVQARKVKPEDDIVQMLKEEEGKIEGMPPTSVTNAYFALGKMYDDLGEPEEAFSRFVKACESYRQRVHYSAEETDKIYARTKEIFTKEFIDKNSGGGYASDTPIFVLGMPRSGTTLTEQIISSHSDVFGAGELHDMMDLTNWRNASSDKANFPESLVGLTPESIRQYGEDYVSRIRKRAETKHITDKMPANFFHIGLIHLALPNAKIVHINRHPLDTCISCFTRFFVKGSQAQTYDLYELGRYYKEYKDLMAYWREVLPEGAFYDINYEDLIDNTEEEARKLIEYCGLEWQDACLEFYKNKRRVRTASVTQVRQPIYKSSVARWKKYEKFLQPLIEGLGDAWDGR